MLKDPEKTMNTVFLSGSMSIRVLNDDIQNRIRIIIDSNFPIVIGDANGADKVLQEFLADLEYKNVTVFCAGNKCRNNIGSWKVNHITVDSKLTGREFYTVKDKAMAAIADYGFVLWDGKSIGSLNNVLELRQQNKYAVVYFLPENQFYNIKNQQDIQNLLDKCNEKNSGQDKSGGIPQESICF